MTRIAMITALGLLASASFGAADTRQLAASAGADAGASLDAIAAAKFNREGGRDEQQTAGRPVPSYSVEAHRALGSVAGIDAEDAGAMSLDALAVAHFNASSQREERQPVVVSSRGTGGTGGRAQLAAQAGADAGMSLDAIYRAKLNRDGSRDEQQ
jgi:hypothetical protein